MSVTDDTANNIQSTENGGWDQSGSTLIQPEKRILLNIGEQSNYTVLPALREDVYTITSVCNINGLLANYPVPHTWNYDVSGDRHIEVDVWKVGGNDSSGCSALIRDRLFNQFKGATPNEITQHVINTSHAEMKTQVSYTTGSAGQLGLMQTYDLSGMIATQSLFNEYLTEDGLCTGTKLDISPSGINPGGSTNGTMFGQLQEALISWFEAANYKDFTLSSTGDTVDPRQHDILRSWMNRDSVDKRHLAKMNENTIKKLLSQDNGSNQVDLTAENTLAYCCFDSDQVKQIFSTVEMTGRIRTENASDSLPDYEKTETGVETRGDLCADGNIGEQALPQDYNGVYLQVPRHKVALRHGEGFAIVVPAKTRLRSGTISQANLLVRMFQSLAGAVTQ